MPLTLLTGNVLKVKRDILVPTICGEPVFLVKGDELTVKNIYVDNNENVMFSVMEDDRLSFQFDSCLVKDKMRISTKFIMNHKRDDSQGNNRS